MEQEKQMSHATFGVRDYLIPFWIEAAEKGSRSIKPASDTQGPLFYQGWHIKFTQWDRPLGVFTRRIKL